jgi:prolipoprotein diacylglyceryltransferase
VVSFPLSIPSPEWSFFDLGPFRIHAYAICILIGIFLATAVTSRRLTKRGGEPGVVLDIILWAVPLGIVGARIFHVPPTRTTTSALARTSGRCSRSGTAASRSSEH